MADVPKCTSWLGHSFKARYSTRPPTLRPAQLSELFWLGVDARERLTRPISTYEGDICVRCGHQISKAGQ